MVFTVFLDKHSVILQRLLDMYVGRHVDSAKVIDFTYGTGALWKDVQGYRVTKCDAQGDETEVYRRNLVECHYGDLGIHDAAVFDPPYLIGRQSFDYSVKVLDGKLTQVIPTQYTGKRSWAYKGVQKYVSNQTLEEFSRRVDELNQKAPTVLKPRGHLFVKILDPRHKGRLIPHHINIVNLLTNFDLQDVFIYIRQGATTWVVKGHAQNLHGFWLVFQVKML